MRKRMAVYDEDVQYAQKLADYMNQKGGLPFTAMAFSSVEKLEQYGKEQKIDLLLADEKTKKSLSQIPVGQRIFLCEGETEPSKDNAVVYKYQSGDCILRDVMACFSEYAVEPALALMGRGARIIGVYSPVNRCGKSALALTIGQVLSRNFPVLYVNLEEYSGLSKLVEEDWNSDLSEVFYLYRQGTFQWMKFKSMVYTWGSMDYIPPVRYGEDLNQMPPEDLALLLGRIAREAGYKRLVVDLGQMGRGALPLLDVCDVIYMPVKEDLVSSAKIEEFEEYLSRADDGRIQNKIEKLYLPSWRPSGSREGYLEQLLWGEIGDFARKLLEGGFADAGQSI